MTKKMTQLSERRAEGASDAGVHNVAFRDGVTRADGRTE